MVFLACARKTTIPSVFSKDSYCSSSDYGLILSYFLANFLVFPERTNHHSLCIFLGIILLFKEFRIYLIGILRIFWFILLDFHRENQHSLCVFSGFILLVIGFWIHFVFWLMFMDFHRETTIPFAFSEDSYYLFIGFRIHFVGILPIVCFIFLSFHQENHHFILLTLRRISGSFC